MTMTHWMEWIDGWMFVPLQQALIYSFFRSFIFCFSWGCSLVLQDAQNVRVWSYFVKYSNPWKIYLNPNKIKFEILTYRRSGVVWNPSLVLWRHHKRWTDNFVDSFAMDWHRKQCQQLSNDWKPWNLEKQSNCQKQGTALFFCIIFCVWKGNCVNALTLLRDEQRASILVGGVVLVVAGCKCYTNL